MGHEMVVVEAPKKNGHDELLLLLLLLPLPLLLLTLITTLEVKLGSHFLRLLLLTQSQLV